MEKRTDSTQLDFKASYTFNSKIIGRNKHYTQYFKVSSQTTGETIYLCSNKKVIVFRIFDVLSKLYVPKLLTPQWIF